MSLRQASWVLLIGALCALPLRDAHADVHVVESEHYRLHWEGARSDAEEALRVLESAWAGFRAFFGAEPKLTQGEKLRVRFYASRDGWVRGIRRDGTWPPRSAGGYYWPPTKTAHLFRQPTQYFTRVLLVHEAAHQFHFLARTRNKQPAAGWYTEGIAEHLSWHWWDGKRITLGVLPGVSLKDYPAAALQEMRDADFDLAAVVGGRRPASRPVSWALLRYLATGREGKPLPGFSTFLRKMDAGGQPWPVFKQRFGRPSRLLPRLLAWLEAHQTPWAQVFNEWEQVGQATLRGRAGVVSAARLKRPAAALSAVVAVPRNRFRWRAGLLLHWSSNEDYTVALVSARGTVQVDRRQGGRWRTLHRSRRPAWGAAERRFEAIRRDGAVVFRLDGRDVGSWRLPGTVLGVALDNADLRFRDVAWR
ncbi:MAG: hypothetical protein QNJ90_05635 [Planctomycetota bacterium]|nr:hypothetical protein [Planctomycetota bacterium]